MELTPLLQFFSGQLFQTVPMPTGDLSGRTFIITGGNSGLGLDAAKHLYRLNCSTIILACRSVEKGEQAKKNILETAKANKAQSSIEVWPLDMASYSSVKDFGRRAASLARLDAAILNAGVLLQEFTKAEGLEQTLTVNVVSTFLLALLLLPTLQNSATQFGILPHIAITGSFVHFAANHKSLLPPDHILERLSDEKTANMGERYNLSKLLVTLCVQRLSEEISKAAKRADKSHPLVVVNDVAPGFCRTPLFRNEQGAALRAGMRIMGREGEEGSRTLVLGALAGKESHGQYMSEGVVRSASKWTRSSEGQAVSQRLWDEVLAIAEQVSPEVRNGL